MRSRWSSLAPELAEFADVVARLAHDRIEGPVALVEDQDALVPEVVRELVAHELLTIGLPVEHGGGGGDLVAALVVVAELAAVLPAAAVAVTDLCVYASAVAGCDPAVQGVLLAGLAQGDRACIIDGASPLSAVTFTAGPAGPVLAVDAGRVESAAGAARAAVLTDDVVVVVAPEVWAGRRCGPTLARSGLRGAPPCTVSFVADPVPTALVSSRPSAVVRRQRQLLLAAAATGVASAAVEHAAAHVDQRHQFGRPLSAFGWVRDTVDRHRQAVDQVRELLLVEARLDPGEPHGPSADALALRAAQGAVDATIDAVQLFGGYGYLREYPVERRLRDALSLRAVAAGSRPARRAS